MRAKLSKCRLPEYAAKVVVLVSQKSFQFNEFWDYVLNFETLLSADLASLRSLFYATDAL